MTSSTRKYPYAATAVVAAVLAGCATAQPIPSLSSPDSAGLVVDITQRAPVRIFTFSPVRVYFARIDGEGGLLQQRIFRSNYVTGGRAYLLNVPPGTYVFVGAYCVTRVAFTTSYSKDLVEQSKVTVGVGDLVVMGRYVVDQGWPDRTDDVETHYRSVMLSMMSSPGIQYRGTLHEFKEDPRTRLDIVRHAKEDLAGSGWEDRIR